MSAIINKVSNLANAAVSKTVQVSNAAVYWTKVSAEMAKLVYKKEAMAPPSTADFKKVYQCALNMLKTPAEQKKLFQQLTSKDNVVTNLAYGAQFVGFFTVGEIIGRRSFFGYPKSASAAHH